MGDEAVTNVGARQLRHELTAILTRVWEGESFEVTERGKPVARLVPVRGRESLLERLVADGRLLPATRKVGQLPKPLPPVRDGITISEALEEQRAERLP